MLKKIIFIFLILLCGCRPINYLEETSNSFTIFSSSGVPALSLLGILDSDNTITINDDTNDLINAFINKSEDIIIAPINIGIDYINQYKNYQLFSIVTFCDMNIISDDDEFEYGKVAGYGKETIIGSLVNYLSETDLRKLTFKWYDSAKEAIEAYDNKEVDAILLDEYSYNYFLANHDNEYFKVENLLEDYEYHTKYSSIPMYGLFVNVDVVNYKSDSLVEFAKTLKNSISTYKTDKTTFNSVLNNADLSSIGFDDVDLISESYNYCGIDFVYASSIFDGIVSILDICGIDVNETCVID